MKLLKEFWKELGTCFQGTSIAEFLDGGTLWLPFVLTCLVLSLYFYFQFKLFNMTKNVKINDLQETITMHTREAALTENELLEEDVDDGTKNDWNRLSLDNNLKKIKENWYVL
ncbi:hypothetical protein ACJX0J_036635, partial [Zea mays]